MYFFSNKKEVKREIPAKKMTLPAQERVASSRTTSNVVARNANGRSVDDYNRMYSAYDNKFSKSANGDTLYIDAKKPAEYGEWVNSFNGSQDDYEYASRLLRFHNPRFAIPVGSSLYWDLVYGPGSFDWNVYSDGAWAYAFPTWSNPGYWNWRWRYDWAWNFGGPWYGWYGRPWSWGFGYSWGWGGSWYAYDPWYYGGWGWPGYGGWYGGWYGRPYYGGGWYAGGNRFRRNGYFYNNQGSGLMASRPGGIRGTGGSRPAFGSASRSSRGNASSVLPSRGNRGGGSFASTSGRVSRGGSVVEARPSSSSVRGDGYTFTPVQQRVIRGTGSRGNSSFERTMPGNVNTYTRPSSTRQTYRGNSRSGGRFNERPTRTQPVERQSFTRERPSTPNYNNSFRQSTPSYNNSGSYSRGGGFSGGSRGGGGFSGGGVRRGR